MKNTFQVQVGRRGIITIPKELRDRNNIEEGNLLTLMDFGDGVLIMGPQRSRVDEIANKVARHLQDSGESLESLLATLRDIRAS